MGEGANIGFLDNILGFAVVAQNASSDPKKPTIVPLHDRTKCAAVALARALHQLGIVRTGVGDSVEPAAVACLIPSS